MHWPAQIEPNAAQPIGQRFSAEFLGRRNVIFFNGHVSHLITNQQRMLFSAWRQNWAVTRCRCSEGLAEHLKGRKTPCGDVHKFLAAKDFFENQGSAAVWRLALSPHSENVLGLNAAGVPVLLCLHGFSLGVLVSSHSPGTGLIVECKRKKMDG